MDEEAQDINTQDEEQSDAPATEEQMSDYLNQAIRTLQTKTDADIFVVSGGISRQLAHEVVHLLQYSIEHRPNALVFLSTFGGDADAAYIIAKTFKGYSKCPIRQVNS